MHAALLPGQYLYLRHAPGTFTYCYLSLSASHGARLLLGGLVVVHRLIRPIELAVVIRLRGSL
jgi:hypothetical protein